MLIKSISYDCNFFFFMTKRPCLLLERAYRILRLAYFKNNFDRSVSEVDRILIGNRRTVFVHYFSVQLAFGCISTVLVICANEIAAPLQLARCYCRPLAASINNDGSL